MPARVLPIAPPAPALLSSSATLLASGLPLLDTLDAVARFHGFDRHDVDLAVPFRVSTTALRFLGNQIETVTGSGEPALSAWLKVHGPALLAGDVAALRAAGIFKVVEGDLVPAYRSRARVGFVGAVRNPATGKWTLVIAVAGSATKRDLPSKEVSGGLSSWVQLVTWTWAWAAAARTMRFVAGDRMTRDVETYAPINGRIKERPGAVYWWGDERIDPRRDDFRAIIGAGLAAGDAKSTKERVLRGRANAWSANRWSEKADYLPLGLYLPEDFDASGVRHLVKTPAIDPSTAPLVQDMFEQAARGVSMTSIALDAATHGARNGRGALLALKVAPLLSPDQIERARKLGPALHPAEADALTVALDHATAPLKRADGVACRRAANEFSKRTFQFLEFYRTGRLRKLYTNTIPGETVIQGIKLTFVCDDERLAPPDAEAEQVWTVADFEARHPNHPLFRVREDNAERFEVICRLGFIDRLLEMPSPVKLSGEEWEAVEKAIPSGWLHRTRTGHRKQQSKPTAPLSQLSWVENGVQHRIRKDHGSYLVLAGPEDAAPSALDPIARFRCKAVHKLAGERLLQLATELETAPEPLPVLVTPTATSEPADPLAAAEQAVTGLQTSIEKTEARYQGLLRDRAAVDVTQSRGRRRHAALTTELEQAEDELDELEQQLNRAEAEAAAAKASAQPVRAPAAPEPRLLEVNSNPLIAVGARLLALANRGEHVDVPELAAAVAWLTQDGALLRTTPGQGRDLDLRLQVRVPSRELPQILDAGTLTLENTLGTGTAHGPAEAPLVPDEAARWTLSDLRGLEYQRRRGWNRAQLVTAVRHWLQSRGVSSGAATALVDQALTGDERLLAPPVVFAWLTADVSATADLAAVEAACHAAAVEAATRRGAACMAEPIVAAYIEHGEAWPARGTGWVRRPLSLTRQLVALLAALPAGSRVARRDVARALGIDLADLRLLLAQDGPATLVGASAADVWLLSCTHGNCGGVLEVVVATPETLRVFASDGSLVACSTCFRLPGDYWDERPLPRVYRETWDAPAKRINLANPKGLSAIVQPPAAAVRQLPERTYSMATAAGRLRIGVGSLQRLIDDGVVRARANHDRRGGFRIPARELERVEVLEGASALRERRYAPPSSAA